jgi:hypothetical protein
VQSALLPALVMALVVTRAQHESHLAVVLCACCASHSAVKDSGWWRKCFQALVDLKSGFTAGYATDRPPPTASPCSHRFSLLLPHIRHSPSSHPHFRTHSHPHTPSSYQHTVPQPITHLHARCQPIITVSRAFSLLIVRLRAPFKKHGASLFTFVATQPCPLLTTRALCICGGRCPRGRSGRVRALKPRPRRWACSTHLLRVVRCRSREYLAHAALHLRPAYTHAFCHTHALHARTHPPTPTW